jgi:hypothetical protein
MVYYRMMHPQSEPYKLLTRIGGRTFNSQPKEHSKEKETHSKTRIRINSKEKKERPFSRDREKERELK